MKRDNFFAGTFYPNSSRDIDSLLSEFQKFSKAEARDDIEAIVVPHAGYIFSGFGANEAYKSIDTSYFKEVVVIGPSHHHYFEGVSVGEFDSIVTPYGELEYDSEFASELRGVRGAVFEKESHKEHSTETQFPFIKKYLPLAKVVEIVYGKADIESIKECVDMTLKRDSTLLVISTDLSHFHKLEDANRLDNICLNAVKNLDSSKLIRECEACGAPGVFALIESAKEKGLKPTLLDYRTSADVTSDTSSVVGYMSAVFTL